MDRTFEIRGGRVAGLVSLAVVAAAMIALDRRPAAAESILLNPPSGWNGIAISGSIRAGWKENGGVGESITSASGFLLAGPSYPPLAPGQVLNGTPLNLSIAPTSGDTKDKAEVTLNYSVTVGAAGPGSSDKFNLDFSGETSATNARVDFGGGLVPADAFIAVDVTLMTFAPVPAATLASIGLPALPLLTALPPNVESLSAMVKVGPFGAPTTIISMGPGASALTLPLVLDTATTDMLEYSLKYTLLTPYGTDPSVSFNLEGSMERSSVPEIGFTTAPVALFAGAFAVLESRTRRRRREGDPPLPLTS